MTFTTSNFGYLTPEEILQASSEVNATWTNSGAANFLEQFFAKNQVADWTLAFFELTVNHGDSSGGSVYDCHDIVSSSCAAPTGDCTKYAPPSAFFIHESIYNFFHTYQAIYQQITNDAVIQLGNTINNISDTFAPPDTSEAELYTLLSGILGSASGVGVVLGDLGAEPLGAVGDGIALFSSTFALTAGNGGGSGGETEALDEILGSTLESVFKSANQSIQSVLQPNVPTNGSLAESYFQDGTFLDSALTDKMVDLMVNGFITTMVLCCLPQDYLSNSLTKDIERISHHSGYEFRLDHGSVL